MTANLFHSPRGVSCIQAFHCDPFTGELQLPLIRRNRIDAMTVSSNSLSMIDYYNIRHTCLRLIEAGYEVAEFDDATRMRLPHDDWTLWAGGERNQYVNFRYHGPSVSVWNEIEISRVPERGRPLNARLGIAFNKRHENRLASLRYEISPQRTMSITSSIGVDDVGIRSLKRYFGLPDYVSIFALRDASCHDIGCSDALLTATHRTIPSDIPEIAGEIGFFYKMEPYSIFLDALLNLENGQYNEEFTLMISAQEGTMESPIPKGAHRLWRWALGEEEVVSYKEKALYRAFVQALVVRPGNQWC